MLLSSVNQETLSIPADLHRRLQAAAAARGVQVTDYLEMVADDGPELPPHRRELVDRFLAWWEGDLTNLGCSVKVAVAKLAGMEWVIPEIEAQRPRREE
jgi:hypothetical protein